MSIGRVVLASGNAGKARELRALLHPFGIDCMTQRELGIADAPEPYATFIENALTKARHAAQASGLPALADDSGICVPSLGGAPGVHSARYAVPDAAGAAHAASGTDASRAAQDLANNARLVAELSRFSEPRDRRAYYYCVLVMLRSADDPQPVIAQASWHGVVLAAPRGAGGFGYDAHFLLGDLGLTAAELPAGQKNQISHRALAMAQLIEQMHQLGMLRSAGNGARA